MEPLIESLFNDPEESDVSIAVGKTEFHCHKLILKKSSPVFNAMFKCNMKESDTNVVNIEDFDKDTVEVFLKFAYGAKSIENLNPDKVIDVIRICDKYDLHKNLKENLFEAIAFLFDRTDYALKIAQAAFYFNMPELEATVVDRIVAMSDLYRMPEDFESLRDTPEFLLKIYDAFIENSGRNVYVDLFKKKNDEDFKKLHGEFMNLTSHQFDVEDDKFTFRDGRSVEIRGTRRILFENLSAMSDEEKLVIKYKLFIGECRFFRAIRFVTRGRGDCIAWP